MIGWRLGQEAFSEFTYGFALTNEFVSMNPPVSVPIFPSLIEEGRGAGYDVRLDLPGKPLFIQFKLSRLIRGRRAVEFQRNEFYAPFYRMTFRARARSRQHDLLVELERQNNGGVFYVAPAFHMLAQLSNHYERRTVAKNSRRVMPSEVNIPDDRQEHWLSFQRAQGGDVYIHSEGGEKIELDERPFSEVLAEQFKLVDQGKPLEATIQSILSWFRQAEVPQRVRLRPEAEAEGRMGQLARLAETAQLALGATLFILQERLPVG